MKIIDPSDPYKHLRSKNPIGIMGMVRNETNKQLESMSIEDLNNLLNDLTEKEWFEDAARVRDVINRKEKR